MSPRKPIDTTPQYRHDDDKPRQPSTMDEHGVDDLDDLDPWDAYGVWAEQPLDDDWVALYRFVWLKGGPALREVHVVPVAWRGEIEHEDALMFRIDSPWGRFLGQTIAGLAPSRGLPSRLLRELRPQEALTQRLEAPTYEATRESILLALHYHPGWRTVSESSWQRHQERLGMLAPSATPLTRTQRLALVAQLYATGLAEGRTRIVAEIALRSGRKAPHVRDDVYAARREGLLTEGRGHGRIGGELTPKARDILMALEGQGTMAD
jgi:hypothetical protein